MTISLVNSQAYNINTTQPSGGATNITLGWTPTNGNTLILTLGYHLNSSADITSITQTGATWQKAINENAVVGQPSNGDAEIWYASNISGASTSISVNLTAGQSNYGGGITVSEWSGLANSNVLDQTASNETYGNTSSMDSGTTGTTAQANELVIASFEVPTVGQANSFSGPTNGFTILGQGTSLGSSSYGAHCATYKIASSTGAFDTQIVPAFSYPSAYNDACIATFKGAGSTVSGVATYTATGSLAVGGHSLAKGASTLSAHSILSATGHSLNSQKTTFTAAASLAAIGHSQNKSTGTFTAHGAFAAAGHSLNAGKGTFSASASLAAVGVSLFKGNVTFPAMAAFIADGVTVIKGTANFMASASLAASALEHTLTISAQTTFAAVGLVRIPTPPDRILLPQSRSRFQILRPRHNII